MQFNVFHGVPLYTVSVWTRMCLLYFAGGNVEILLVSETP